MTRVERLLAEHQKIHKQIDELERERSIVRNFEHKALLKSLKTRRLHIKTELNRETV